jgi:hypothetical protein
MLETRIMNTQQRILTDIARLTSNIGTNYPELYRFLDENPTTIPSYAHPLLDQEALEEYLGDLKELLKRHLQNNKIASNEKI